VELTLLIHPVMPTRSDGT